MDKFTSKSEEKEKKETGVDTVVHFPTSFSVRMDELKAKLLGQPIERCPHGCSESEEKLLVRGVWSRGV